MTDTIKLEEMPDRFAGAEAHWMASAAGNAMALRQAYLQIMQDRKAAADWDRVVVDIERGARRIFGPNEADFLMRKARESADVAVANLKASMAAQEATQEPQEQLGRAS